MDGQSLFCLLNIFIFLAYAAVGILFFFPPLDTRSCLFDQIFLIVHGGTAAFFFFLVFAFILSTRSTAHSHKAKPILTFATGTCCVLTLCLISGGVVLFGLSSCTSPSIRVVALSLWVFTIMDFFFSCCASLICRGNSCAEAGYATFNNEEWGEWGEWGEGAELRGEEYSMGTGGQYQ